MKKFFSVLFIFSLIVQYVIGQSNHTVSFTGNASTDFYAAERYGSVDNVDYYATFDQTYIYFGAFRTNNNTWGQYDHFTIYIDSDPKSGVTSGGNGTTTGVNWDGNTPTLPIQADYRIAIRRNGSGESFYSSYSSSSWSTGAANAKGYTQYVSSSSNGALEIKIPWTDLGSPNAIYFILYCSYNSGYFGSAPTGTAGAGPASGKYFGGIGVSSAGCIPNNITNSPISDLLNNGSPASGAKYGKITISTGTNTAAGDFAIASGGSIVLTGGTLDLSSRTVSMGVGTTISNSSGTITPGTSTVNFVGAGTFSGSSSISLNNISFANNSTINVANSVTSSQIFNMVSGATNTFNFTNNATFTTAGINSAGSNTLNLLNGGSSGSSKFITSSDLTITTGTALSLGTSALPLQVNGNITLTGTGSLTLGSSAGGDILLTGNWSRGTGTFTPSGRAVTFNGTGTQTMTNTNSGLLSFDYLAINNGGSVQLASNVSVNNNLQLFTGTLDLNQKTLTLNNNLEIGNGSGSTTESIISSGGTGTISIPSSKNTTVSKFNGAGIPAFSFGNNVLVSVSGTFNPGSGLTTFASGSTLQLNNGGSVATNSPTYNTGSSLIYNLNNGSGAKFNQSFEWPASSGPSNVSLLNNSWVQLTGDHSLTGNLTVTSGALQATGALRTLTMSGTTQTITVSNSSGGAIYGTENGFSNDLQLTIGSTSTTTFTGDATTNSDDEKKFLNIVVNNGGTLSLSCGILCKWGSFTVNGTLQINALGYIQSKNTTNSAPATSNRAASYTNGNLIYNNGGSYSTTDYEWPALNSPANVTIQSTGTNVTLTGARTISGNLTVSAGSLTIESTKSLTVSGILTNYAGNAGLVIMSDVNGTGSLITSSSPAATVERYLVPYNLASDKMYHFLSSPVSAQPIRTEFVSNNPITAGQDCYSYDEVNNLWINSRGTGDIWNTSFENNFAVGKGYLVAYPSIVTKKFTGTLNSYPGGSPLTLNCTNTPGQGNGWNLLGNPFPSAMDWDYITTNGLVGVDNALYYYDNTAANYRYYIQLGSYGSLGSGQRYIPAMQGFMVHATTSATKTVKIDNNSRTHSGQNVFYKSANTELKSISLKASHNGYEDEAFIYFLDGATTAFDGNFDAFKLKSYSENVPMIYTTSSDGSDLAINGLSAFDATTLVPVNFKADVAGDYTLSTNLSAFTGIDVYLTDKKLNQDTKLNENTAYTFTSEAGDDPNRFLLHFMDVTSVPDAAKESFSVYISNGTMNITTGRATNADIRVSNMAGQVVLQGKTNGNTLTSLSTATLRNGVYVVTLLGSSMVESRKIVLNR